MPDCSASVDIDNEVERIPPMRDNGGHLDIFRVSKADNHVYLMDATVLFSLKGRALARHCLIQDRRLIPPLGVKA